MFDSVKLSDLDILQKNGYVAANGYVAFNGYYTSNVRCAVDRELVYIGLVP